MQLFSLSQLLMLLLMLLLLLLLLLELVLAFILQLSWLLGIWPSPPASCLCPLLAMVGKSVSKHNMKKDAIALWLQEEGLANAMRYAISGQGIPPPAPWSNKEVLSCKDNRNNRKVLPYKNNKKVLSYRNNKNNKQVLSYSNNKDKYFEPCGATCGQWPWKCCYLEAGEAEDEEVPQASLK